MGLYHHYQFFVFGLLCLLLLCVTVWIKKEFSIYTGKYCLLSVLFLSTALLSLIMAPDRGEAFEGVLRIIVVLVFVILLMQFDREPRDILKFLPESAAVMVLISSLGYLSGGIRDFLFYKDRMGGFFQYPNTFAFFLLLSLMLLIFYGEGKKRGIRQGCYVILLGGIFLSGSRMVFVLFLVSFPGLFFVERGKKKSLLIGSAVLGLFLAVLCLLGKASLFTRVFQISLTDTYVLERMLFWKDSIPCIAKYPLGSGYGGYYILQGLFQTGAYSTRHVHNEWLQTALDYGIVPALILVLLTVSCLTEKQQDAKTKMLMALYAFRFCFDIDQRYGCMLLFFAALIPAKTGKRKTVQISGTALKGFFLAGGIYAAFLLWTGGANALLVSGREPLSYRLYPACMEAAEMTLAKADDYAAYCPMAEKVLQKNPYCVTAWRVVAYAAFEEGDFETMSNALEQRVNLEKYKKSAYQDYIQMHYAATRICMNDGDTSRAAALAKKGARVADLRQQALDRISELAKKCKDAPKLKLSKQDREAIEYLKQVE
ncbi:MAG: O-antigen ligase family protein [Lachnospiraceae bacterium]|nr:O-antigen ligase family protein [Lachnospiraceae bacterium]